jgi:hypothetical protein
LNIFAAGHSASQKIACSDGAPESEIEQTVTAGAGYNTVPKRMERKGYFREVPDQK